MNRSQGDRGWGRAGQLAPAVSAAGADEGLLGAADQPAPADSLPRRLRAVYRRRVGPTEQSLLVAWAAFAVTFGLTRAVTHWIRAGHGPRGGGLSAGGEHLHHYNIGIALLAGVGGVALDCIKAFSETDFTEDLGKFDVPTLIAHGDDDQIVPIGASALRSSKLIEGSTLKVYPGAPHGLVGTYKDEFNADLLTFIRIWPQTSSQP